MRAERIFRRAWYTDTANTICLKEYTMWNDRARFLKGLVKGVTTVLRTTGSALGSLYDKGVVMVHQAQNKVLHSEKGGLNRTINESRMKILALKCEIGKESARLKWYRLLKQAGKH